MVLKVDYHSKAIFLHSYVGGHVDVSKLQDGTSPEARWRHAATSFRSDGVDYILVTGMKT